MLDVSPQPGNFVLWFCLFSVSDWVFIEDRCEVFSSFVFPTPSTCLGIHRVFMDLQNKLVNEGEVGGAAIKYVRRSWGTEALRGNISSDFYILPAKYP